MRWLSLALPLLLGACAPSFRQVENCAGTLCLSLTANELALESDGFQYGGVMVYADSVTSPFCIAPCNASEGALLRLPEGEVPYPPVLTLGSVKSLRKADASVVMLGANEAVDVTLTAPKR